MNISVIAKNLINLIYPLHCAACARPLDPINKERVCKGCLERIRQNPKPYCRKCGRSTDKGNSICAECRKTKLDFDRAWAACLYEGPMKELIHSLKYNGVLSLSTTLSRIINSFIMENSEILNGIDIVTYVPLHSNRMRKRGFNQSLILASNLSKEFAIPLSHALFKAASTRNQNELTRDERLVNLDGAFKLKSGMDLTGVKVLLIDDVMTTGATLSECAKVLKNAGAKVVRCLTLARGI